MPNFMNAIPLTPETDALARRLIWFDDPRKSLADPIRLLAYAFEFATIEDMTLLRCYVSDDDLRTALDAAPPGIIRPCSWTYWHAMFGRDPAPPMPVRRFG
jgi:hypothetical protein